jgi:HD-GYP domain-containing protein (c-di-GMP phosphodiesterase class II)
MKLCQPLAEHLKIKQPLPWNVLDSNGLLLLRKGYVIDDERTIETLLKRGVCVDEEDFNEYLRGQPGQQEKQGTPERQEPAEKPFDPFQEWEQVYDDVGVLLREHQKVPDFVARTTAICTRIDTLTDHDSDVGIFVMARLDVTRYPVAHSLQTAFVCGLIARRLQWSDEDRGSLMKAALTMNIAMVDLQTVLSRQVEPLTAEQRARIAGHPTAGRARLEALGVNDEKWLRAVLEHHESPDGSGYPNRITEMSQLAEILHYSDIYCALISPRAYRKGLLPQQAARNIYLTCNSTKSSIAALIVKEVGLYPPGYFVKLANGDLAIVVHRGRQANTPQVCSLVTGAGLTNLEPLRRDTSQAEFAVISGVPAEDVLAEVRPEKLYGYRV